MILRSVLFPEPFLPMRPRASPERMSKVTSFNAQSVSLSSRNRLWNMPMTCDFNELFRLCRITKAFETFVISIAVDKELYLFCKSGFQTHEKHITRCNHQDSQHCQNSNFLKRRKSIVVKRVLIREDKKRNRVQVNHRLQSWCYRSYLINNRGKPKKQHQ